MQVNLGTYDRRFLTNTLNLNIGAKKPVTTNQSALLDKIIDRYSRQLAKKELSVGELISLPWSLTPVDSKPEFTEAFLRLDDTVFILRSPYKSAFVRAMRELNYSIWHLDEKFWSIPAGLYTLHRITDLLTEFYDTVNYCPEIISILNQVKEYPADLHWDPTLTKKNGRLYVTAINSSLHDAIKDISLTEEISSLARLVRYGINVDTSLINEVHDAMGGAKEDMDQLVFSLQNHPKIDIAEPTKLVKYIVDLKPDAVILSDIGTTSYASVMSQIAESLELANVNVIKLAKASDVANTDISKYEYPIVLNLGSMRRHNIDLPYSAGKQVHVVNSTPIDLFRKK